MDALALGLIIFTSIVFFFSIIAFILSFFRKEPTKLQKDLWTLEKEIKSMRKQEMMDGAIIKKLSDAGWDGHVVELVIHDLRKPNHKIEKLQNYVDSRLRKGDSKEFLKETLVEAGWSADLIDLVLRLD
ncbi:MAG: hypothetical protein KKE20_02885 [Nanoarchaeota archaeon]|nr:hypothetical protein [Nanoarchaeota archaeon]